MIGQAEILVVQTQDDRDVWKLGTEYPADWSRTDTGVAEAYAACNPKLLLVCFLEAMLALPDLKATGRALLGSDGGLALSERLHGPAICGLRINEALGLRWSDVDLPGGRLTVAGQLAVVDGERVRADDPKTDRSRRTIRVVPEPALDALRQEQRVAMEQGRYWIGRKDGLVFADQYGATLSDRHVRREFYRRLAAAEWPRLRQHDLRHACATTLLANGVQPHVVVEILGDSVKTVMSVYAQVRGHGAPGCRRRDRSGIRCEVAPAQRVNSRSHLGSFSFAVRKSIVSRAADGL